MEKKHGTTILSKNDTPRICSSSNSFCLIQEKILGLKNTDVEETGTAVCDTLVKGFFGSQLVSIKTISY